MYFVEGLGFNHLFLLRYVLHGKNVIPTASMNISAGGKRNVYDCSRPTISIVPDAVVLVFAFMHAFKMNSKLLLASKNNVAKIT